MTVKGLNSASPKNHIKEKEQEQSFRISFINTFLAI